MDKQTLSSYGWIIITVLILAVMLAFATPFGQYIGRGVSNFAKSLVGASDNAIDSGNIEQMGKEWEDYLGVNEPNLKGNEILYFGSTIVQTDDGFVKILADRNNMSYEIKHSSALGITDMLPP